jgi:hypothetical protein
MAMGKVLDDDSKEFGANRRAGRAALVSQFEFHLAVGYGDHAERSRFSAGARSEGIWLAPAWWG